jgi:ribosome biogenesis GTPase
LENASPLSSGATTSIAAPLANLLSAAPTNPPVAGPLVTEKRLTGRVVRTQSGFFTVETENGLLTCQISGRLKIEAQRAAKKEEIQRSDLVALNDQVTAELETDGSGTIVAVAERRNVLSRVAREAAAGTSAESEQVIIANTDQVILVFSAAKPAPNPRALDRLLVCAEKAHIPSILICVNKIDLVTHEEAETIFGVYRTIGYPLLYTSALTGEGVENLKSALTGDPQRASVFTGPSGVGKSSLLNAMQAGLKLATNAVSQATTKGRHTTQFSQLIKFDTGGYVADTPGLRAIVPWDVEPHELDGYFIEMRPYIAHCKFADCSHRHEPGCAVRAALEGGQITCERHESYLRLREELEEQYIY